MQIRNTIAVVALAAAAMLGAGAMAPSAQAATAQPQAVQTAAQPAQAAGIPYGGAQFNTDGVRIRSCPDLNCTVLGLGYRSHHVAWYCLEHQNGFVHILDYTTGVDGWSSDQLTWYWCD